MKPPLHAGNGRVFSRYSPHVVLVAGIALSVLASQMLARSIETAAKARFDGAVSDAHKAIESRIHVYSDVLLGVRGLFLANGAAGSVAFRDYIGSLDLARRYPGIQVIHYAQRISAAEKPGFEAMVRKDTGLYPAGNPGFKVKPEGERAEYVVVRHVEPLAGNETTPGLDLDGDPVRSAALARMRDSGRLTASGPIALGLDPRKHPGFAMRLPLYRRGMPAGTAAERRAALEGVVSASFVVIDLMKGVLSEPLLRGVHVTVHDAGPLGAPPTTLPPAAERLMFDSNRLSPVSVVPLPAGEAGSLAGASDLEVGGRRWELRFRAGPAFADAADHWLPLAALLGGITISLLLAGLMQSLAVSGRRAAELADRATADLRTSEASLLDAQSMTRQLIEALPNPIFFKDTDGRYLGVNKAWEQFFGRSRQDFIGKSVFDLFPEDPDVAAQMHEKDLALWASPGTQEYEAAITTPGGLWRQVIYYKATFTRADGVVAGLIGTIIDITERASLEAQLRESQKMQAIGTLAGGIAHDFNNIIAAILGNAELARDDVRGNPVALQSLEEIRKAGARARNLVQQILSFSRREPVARKAIALAPVIAESVGLLRATLPARIALDVRSDDDVPPVLADATQIQQVLINLATNAMQAMRGGAGHIAIRLDTVPLDSALAAAHPVLQQLTAGQQARVVRLVVGDDGPGMDEGTLARIFEPFFTTKPVNEGTGLGLSVVLGIVQGHEGAIEVSSAPGKGSSFTIYLPCAAADEALTDSAPLAPAAAPAPLPGRTVAATETGGRHILYIDDDEALVFLVGRLLERSGYRVSGHTEQAEGLAALRADPDAFDLVLSDYNMPGMSGLDVAREVRAIRADLPVAIASGFIDETLREQAGGAGVRELLFKATDVEVFCETVKRLAGALPKAPASV